MDLLLPSRFGLSNTLTSSPRCGKTPNECPGYDIKQSVGEAPVMLELWGMRVPFIAIAPMFTLALLEPHHQTV